MSQIRIHAVLGELLAYLNLDVDPENCLDLLSEKDTAPDGVSNMAEQVALAAAKLSQNAPHRFSSIYNKVKKLKEPELDPIMYILQAFYSEPAPATPRNRPLPSTPVGTLLKKIFKGTPEVTSLSETTVRSTPGNHFTMDTSCVSGMVTGSTLLGTPAREPAKVVHDTQQPKDKSGNPFKRPTMAWTVKDVTFLSLYSQSQFEPPTRI